MTKSMTPEDVIEQTFQALEQDRPEEALELIRLLDGDDPVVAFLTGVSLMVLDRSREAIRPLTTAVSGDPEDDEFKTTLALAQYRGFLPEEATRTLDAVRSPDDPDANFIRGLVAEWTGDWDGADAAFRRAAELAPEAYRSPNRLSPEAFEALVRESGERLPEIFRGPLEDVTVRIEPLPDQALLTAEEPWLEPDLFGLFVGPTQADRGGSTTDAGGLDSIPQIYLFQRILEREASDRLEDEIAITLYHELGHYLGMDEEQLEDVGLA